MAAKIPQLLGQYLYKNRKMPLPGLGIFTLDKSVVLPDENDRALLSMPNGVQFQNANIVAADKELISFICENTGKIRPLAISDLDSYLNLGTEMLNIGKPFYLEGIGTITRSKSGKFDFSPGDYMGMKESGSSPGQEKKFYAKDKKQATTTDVVPESNGLKMLALAAAIIIVGLGGWLIYKKNSPPALANVTDTATILQQPVFLKDSQMSEIKKPDTDRAVKPAENAVVVSATQSPTSYRFIILETPDKARAIKRYAQLIQFDLKAHISLKDTTNFKVYFQLPALAKDTFHIKDSLRREYAHPVVIEQ